MSEKDEVKKTVLDAESEIYNRKRVDGTSKEEWKSMSGKQKFNHFMYYNLKYIIVAIAAVFVLVYIIHGMRKSKTSDTFYCGMFNGIYLNPESVEDLKLSLWDYMTKDDGFTGSRNTDRMYFKTFNDGYEDNILIDGNYDKKRFDVIIANEETYKIYAGNGQAIDLKEILNPESLDKIGNDIVTTTNNELGKTGSYGIKINKEILPLYNKDGEEYESTVLFVIKNTTRLDAAVEFIKYLYRN